MTSENPSPSRESETVDNIIAEYLDAKDKGNAPDTGEWLKQYPQHAAELEEFLQDQKKFQPQLQKAQSVTVSEPTPAPKVNTEWKLPCLFQDYDILEIIARGGMGIVFKARQISLNRMVALKMILSGQFAKPNDIQRFLIEVEVAGTLDHPNIVPVYHMGEEQGQYFYSMKLIEGTNLRNWVKNQAEETLNHERQRTLTTVFHKIASAVHYAHQRGILHRDLKPGNILIDNANEPHVTDFGLAKRISGAANKDKESPTATGAILGTPEYMSPEQADGKPNLSVHSDVYGLGAIYYYMLTGQPPIQGKSPVELLKKVIETDPTPPRQINGHIDRDLQTICLTCLQKTPDGRYESAGELAEDLDRWLMGKPILARPTSQWEQIIKWIKRNPALTSLIGVIVLTVLSIMGLQWFNGINLQAERDKAEGERKKAIGERKKAVEQKEEAVKQEKEAKRLQILAEEREELKTRYLYLANTSLAEHALKNGHVGRALDLLEAHRPQKGQPDLRHLEWYLLWQQCHQDLATFTDHANTVRAARFSPDGKHLVTVDSDGKLVRRDLVGKKIHSIILPTDTGFKSMTISADAKRLATCTRDSVIQVWDAQTGKQLARCNGPALQFKPLALSPDGKLLAYWVENKSIAIWDYSNDDIVANLVGHKDPPTSFSFSANGKTLASGGLNGLVYLWQLSNQQLIYHADLHNGPIWDLQFSPDQKLLLTGSFDQNAKILFLEKSKDGKLPGTILESKRGMVRSVAFSPDGQLIATVGSDQVVKLWSGETFKQLHVFRGHADSIGVVRFSPNGKTLMSAASDKTTKLWDVEAPLRAHFKAHRQNILTMAFSPDGNTLVSSGVDSEIHAWDTATGNLKFTVRHSATVYDTIFTPAGKTLIVGGLRRTVDGPLGGVVRLWNMQTQRADKTWDEIPEPVHNLALSPDGKTLAAGCAEGKIYLWDLTTNRAIPEIASQLKEITSLAFSTDGKILAAGGPTLELNQPSVGDIELWDWQAQKRRKNLKGHSQNVWDLAFHPDGTHMASCSTDGTVKLWEMPHGKASITFHGHMEAVRKVAFTPDGKRIVSVGGDRRLHLWDPTTQLEFVALDSGQNQIWSLAISPDGNTLATGDGDGTIRMWRATNQTNTQR